MHPTPLQRGELPAASEAGAVRGDISLPPAAGRRGNVLQPSLPQLLESILLPWLRRTVSPSPGNGFGVTAASSALSDHGCSISRVIFRAFCRLLCVCACVCVCVLAHPCLRSSALKQLSVLHLGTWPGQYVQLEQVKKKGKCPKKSVEKKRACSIILLLERWARRYPASSSAKSKHEILLSAADEPTQHFHLSFNAQRRQTSKQPLETNNKRVS